MRIDRYHGACSNWRAATFSRAEDGIRTLRDLAGSAQAGILPANS